jgi:hypothetical protein
LHPDGRERLGRLSPAVGSIRNFAAVEPDVPGDVVGLVVQVVNDGRMVRIDRRDILPERQAVPVGHRVLADVLPPLPCVGPVQIQHDIDPLRSAELHHFIDEGAIGLAFVVLFRRFSKPAVLAQRQANVIDVPVLDGDADRFEDMPFAVTGPFEAGAVDAAQSHRLVLAVENLRPDHS